MYGLYEKPLVLVLVLVLWPGAGTSPILVPEPIRCAPCSQEQLDRCPAVAPGCSQVLREPGCGCCMACALQRGAACGVHTPHCQDGLRCTPRPGETQTTTRPDPGTGVCTQDPGPEDSDLVVDHSSLHYLLGLNLPVDHQDTAEGHESIKAKVNAIRSKLVQQGPCHVELHAALDVIASSQQKLGEKFTTFYLPNCDKHGYYKAKQCESSLVGPPSRCWCVSSWNGKKIPGSSDILGDGECHQEVTY